jgi:hypothetical protein
VNAAYKRFSFAALQESDSCAGFRPPLLFGAISQRYATMLDQRLELGAHVLARGLAWRFSRPFT